MNHKITIIGLGYVGLPLARLFSTKYPVVGFDINEKRIAELNSGKDDTLEGKILSICDKLDLLYEAYGEIELGNPKEEDMKLQLLSTVAIPLYLPERNYYISRKFHR